MDQSSLMWLRRQAKLLKASLTRLEVPAIMRVREAFRVLASTPDNEVRGYAPLQRCQFVLAHEGGVSSWKDLTGLPEIPAALRVRALSARGRGDERSARGHHEDDLR